MRRLGMSLAVLALALCASLPAAAAAPPSIQIVNLHSGQVVYGSTLTVRVAVSHFKLVPPVLLPPADWKTIPLLKGNQGHIHYVLDSVSNMVLTRDVVVRTYHTWTHVSPGWHTVIAYLATSQHAQFPGTKAATVRVRVERHPAPAPAPAPAIRITNVSTTNAGGTVDVMVHVAVSHFKMVAPVYKNPPLLPGNQGHIHYVLDSLANFQAQRDAATALDHPWTHVAPGWHTIIAYLATSQHKLFPGSKPASVRVYVPPQAMAIALKNLPTTGGADSKGGSRLPWLPWVAALTLLGAMTAVIRLRASPAEIG